MTQPLTQPSAFDLTTEMAGKHYFCDLFTKVGTVRFVRVQAYPPHYTPRAFANVVWWWGDQVGVNIPVEELEEIETFSCVINK
jgi:hypothetical protein